MNNYYTGVNPMPNYTDPYFPQQVQQPKPMEQYQGFAQVPPQQVYNKPVVSLQGKLAESLDVIKATEVSFDGTISYFPLTDGSAIITKQLQPDGTTKMVTYKPTIENEKVEMPQYITSDELKEALEKIEIKDYSKEIEELKKQIEKLKDKKEK